MTDDQLQQIARAPRIEDVAVLVQECMRQRSVLKVCESVLTDLMPIVGDLCLSAGRGVEALALVRKTIHGDEGTKH